MLVSWQKQVLLPNYHFFLRLNLLNIKDYRDSYVPQLYLRKLKNMNRKDTETSVQKALYKLLIISIHFRKFVFGLGGAPMWERITQIIHRPTLIEVFIVLWWGNSKREASANGRVKYNLIKARLFYILVRNIGICHYFLNNVLTLTRFFDSTIARKSKITM